MTSMYLLETFRWVKEKKMVTFVVSHMLVREEHTSSI